MEYEMARRLVVLMVHLMELVLEDAMVLQRGST